MFFESVKIVKQLISRNWAVPDNFIKIILFSYPLVLFWERKTVTNEGNTWGRRGVYLRKFEE